MFSTKFSDDEDDLFAAKPSKHLANLFNTPMQQSEDEALPSLKYVAPKQSVIKNENDSVQAQQPSVAQNTVVLAKRVTAYKYMPDKQYAVHGVLGFALVEVTKARFKIILYKDKQNIISSNNFINNTKITIQDRYCYYTDDLQRSWAVLFENNKDLQEFLDKIKNTDIELIMSNDNKQSESNKNTSDTSDSKKSDASNAVVNNKASPEEKPDIKDTKAKILSLMEKMGQTKLLPEIGGASTTVDNTTDSSDTETSPNKPMRDAMKISKPLVKPRKLDNRTVGLKSTPGVVSTSIVNVPQYALVNGQLVPIIQTPQTTSSAICLPSPQMHSLDLQNQHMIATSNNNSGGGGMLSGSSSNDNLNLYLCENRIHNSELRMNVSKLEQKLDRVLDEIKDMSRGDTMMTRNTLTNTTSTPEEILQCIRKQEKRQTMEIDLLKTKLKNFEDHFREDKKRTDSETSDRTTIDVIADYENKIETLELKLRDFECFYNEKTPILQKYKEDLVKIVEYEKEIAMLKLKLQDFETRHDNKSHAEKSNLENDRMSNLTQKSAEILEQRKTIEDLRNKLKLYQDQNYERELITCRDQIENLEQNLRDTQNEKRALHDTNHDLTEKLRTLDELRKKLSEYEVDKQLESNDVLEQRIKDIMSGVFGKLSESFPTHEHFEGSAILRICKQVIRTVTLECLKTDSKTKDEIIDKGPELPPIPPDFDA